MKDMFHHRGHRGNTRSVGRLSLCPLCLCVLCGKSLFGVILAALLTSAIMARPQTRQPLPPEKRIRYQIHLALAVENPTYTGRELVGWVSRADHPPSTFSFRLYPT